MWYRLDHHGILLSVLAKPHAKKTSLIEVAKDALHIALQARPHEGAANKELIHFLSKYFRVPQRDISLIRGTTSRYKQLKMPLSKELQDFINNHTNPMG